ncbi:Papain-like cysteine peptidase superfamily [Sesbania bispinosa]|nr:Papain-like cysteine peptidase superfamily [Sesbania bispinosa]
MPSIAQDTQDATKGPDKNVIHIADLDDGPHVAENRQMLKRKAYETTNTSNITIPKTRSFLQTEKEKAYGSTESNPCMSYYHRKSCAKIDIVEGKTLEEMIKTYAKDWMHAYDDLRYVYIPIQEHGDHWYLMAMSIKERIIYYPHPDVIDETIQHIQETMKTVGKVISQMMKTDFFPPNYMSELNDNCPWEVKGTGLKTESNAKAMINSPNEYVNLNSSNQPMMNEKCLRMRIALDLLMGEHNKEWNMLDMKSKSFWLKV